MVYWSIFHALNSLQLFRRFGNHYFFWREELETLIHRNECFFSGLERKGRWDLNYNWIGSQILFISTSLHQFYSVKLPTPLPYSSFSYLPQRWHAMVSLIRFIIAFKFTIFVFEWVLTSFCHFFRRGRVSLLPRMTHIYHWCSWNLKLNRG